MVLLKDYKVHAFFEIVLKFILQKEEDYVAILEKTYFFSISA